MKNVNDCDICIADDGQYKLFTNKEGTLFTAGCHKRISRDEAITHWCKRSWSGENEQGRHLNDLEIKRARLFHKAITDYIEKIDFFEKIKEEKMDFSKELRADDSVSTIKTPTTLEEIEAQRKELDRIEAELKRKPWKPVDGQMYWLVWEDGDIDDNRWEDDTMDMERLEMGNIYKTEAEAEKARDKRKAEVRLRNLIQELQGDWVADWCDNKKAYLWLNRNSGRVAYETTYGYQNQGSIYFNPDIADKLIERIPEQDIKLLFDLEV